MSEVTPEFVREAYNLLRQSIISVEKDDVEVEDEEEEGAAADAEAGANADAEMGDGEEEVPSESTPAAPGASSTPGPSQARERTKITYDKYMTILNMLVRRVNADAATSEDGVEEEELLVWYLEQKEAELETQEDLEAEQTLAKKVLKRMVKVSILSILGILSVELTATPGQHPYADPWRGSRGRPGPGLGAPGSRRLRHAPELRGRGNVKPWQKCGKEKGKRRGVGQGGI